MVWVGADRPKKSVGLFNFETMKKLIPLLSAFALAASISLASDFPQAWANRTESFTLLSATTNQTGDAKLVEFCTQHTVQIINTTIRTNTVYLDRSLDGSNWVAWYTNEFTTTGTVAEATCTGKWSFMRGRVDTLTGTSCAITFRYLGGK